VTTMNQLITALGIPNRDSTRKGVALNIIAAAVTKMTIANESPIFVENLRLFMPSS